jgi:FeS assembly SUF system protein
MSERPMPESAGLEAPAEGEHGAAVAAQDPSALREAVISVLRTVYDPEIPVDIYELGLVYDVNVDGGGGVSIRMTLTSPGCPVAGTLPPEVEQKVQAVPGVTHARVDVVWDPPWDPSKMSEAARLELGM